MSAKLLHYIPGLDLDLPGLPEGERRDSNPRPGTTNRSPLNPATTRFWTGRNASSESLSPASAPSDDVLEPNRALGGRDPVESVPCLILDRSCADRQKT